ncbi:DUF3322 and DUF2220 domain-containing protein [Nocardioides cynanchi]|uniref:DUF3322 and DUF2220 domain-containing protein n=1 Tax=Nocardioides cynanchi TaxID=2558918 RepID=UPI001248C243|nr:DUF3322 and DUF2220 domain-containing protein [Nocardioides cynanchi]
MKTPDRILADVRRRLDRTWAAALAGTGGIDGSDGGADEAAWPHAFPVGQPSSRDLGSDFPAAVRDVAGWRDWAATHDATLRYRSRVVLGTPQQFPTHLEVPDLDSAARLCGPPWPERLARGRDRLAVLTERYPHLTEPSRVVSSVDSYSPLDFGLLCRAADWFASRGPAEGRPRLTPRQVPIEGLHAKWLNTRHALVRELAGIDDLGLLPPHQARIHFTYLDPDYRARGGRIHDSATVGDAVTLPYQPKIVVISENKDTAIHFPPVSGGVSIEGMGRGGNTAAAFDWLVNAPALFYWGDMDADGLEILDGFRAAGVAATSLLMGTADYDTWERFGTNHDPRGRPLAPRNPRPTPHLTANELALYQRLISPGWTRHRRIEQERIPLDSAAQQLHRVVCDNGQPSRSVLDAQH